MRFQTLFAYRDALNGFSIDSSPNVPLAGRDPLLRGAAAFQFGFVLVAGSLSSFVANGTYPVSLSAQVKIYKADGTLKGTLNYEGQYSCTSNSNFLQLSTISDVWTFAEASIFRPYNSTTDLSLGASAPYDTLFLPGDASLSQTLGSRGNFSRYRLQIFPISPVYLFTFNPTDYYVAGNLTFSTTLPLPPNANSQSLRLCNLPIPSFTATSGEEVVFNGSASSIFSDAANSIADYGWDFGDGANQHTATPTTTHAYADELAHTAKLKTTDIYGSFDSVSHPATGIVSTSFASTVDPTDALWTAPKANADAQLYRTRKALAARETMALIAGCKAASMWFDVAQWLWVFGQKTGGDWRLWRSFKYGATNSFSEVGMAAFDSTYSKGAARGLFDGSILAIAVETSTLKLYSKISRDKGATWSTRILIATLTASAQFNIEQKATGAIEVFAKDFATVYESRNFAQTWAVLS